MKHLTEWLKFVNSKVYKKIALDEAQAMSVQKFCQKHGGLELYEKCANTWAKYEDRNFALECQDIYLEKLDFYKTGITVFCLSNDTQARSYQTYLFLLSLIESHNSFWEVMKKIKGFKALDAYLP